MPYLTTADGGRGQIEAFAASIGVRFGHASVLVFWPAREGESGDAARFVFRREGEALSPSEISELGVEGCTTGEDITVFAVNDEQVAAVRRLADALGAVPERTLGALEFVGSEGR